MKKYLVNIEGVTPLIMHNAQGADPLNKYVKEMKPIQKKRTGKTDSDIEKLADLQFLCSLYWSDSLGGLYMPSENIQRMLLDTAKTMDSRGARKQIVSVNCTHFLGYPFMTKDRDNMEKLVADPQRRYTKSVVVSRSRVVATRSIFHEWSVDVGIEIDNDTINPETVREWFEFGGRYKGLCARRPGGPTPGKFGMFIVNSFVEE